MNVEREKVFDNRSRWLWSALPCKLLKLPAAVRHRCIKPQFSVLRGELCEFLSEGSFFGHTLVSIVVLQYEIVSNKLHQIVSQ